jgi:hypothetical protein
MWQRSAGCGFSRSSRHSAAAVSNNRHLSSRHRASLTRSRIDVRSRVRSDWSSWWSERGVPLVLHSPPAPHFPWPPARASFEQSLATERLGAADVQLGAAAEKLVAGLREAGMQRPELSEIATGFFLAGQLEAIHPDGTPLAGHKRWNASVGRSLSFDDYLLDLFFEPPGHYRAVAMAVTGSDAAERMRPSHATYFGFGSALSQPIAALTLEARRVTAFVYTFQRERGGVLIPGYQGSPDGMTHLKASGLLDVIDR